MCWSLLCNIMKWHTDRHCYRGVCLFHLSLFFTLSLFLPPSFPLRCPRWSRMERRWLVRLDALLNHASPTLACLLVSWLSWDHQEGDMISPLISPIFRWHFTKFSCCFRDASRLMGSETPLNQCVEEMCDPETCDCGHQELWKRVNMLKMCFLPL